MIYLQLPKSTNDCFIEYTTDRSYKIERISATTKYIYKSADIGPDDIGMLTILCGIEIVSGVALRSSLQQTLDLKGKLIGYCHASDKTFVTTDISALI